MITTDHHPGPAVVGLIIEIADSGLARDRGEKRDLYARAGVPVYWIVNLAGRCLEVHARPADGAFPPALMLAEDQSVELILDDRPLGRVPVADLLPQRS
jgi:Uma2 family endonuclease